MVSYALANVGRLSEDFLWKHASPSNVWPVPGDHSFTLEATAYALLALLKTNELEKAGAVVRWLNTEKASAGMYGSIQSTLIVYQAVAEYRTRGKELLNVSLQVTVDPGPTHRPTTWTFNRRNALVSRWTQVTARGTGLATLTVSTRRALTLDQNDSIVQNLSSLEASPLTHRLRLMVHKVVEVVALLQPAAVRVRRFNSAGQSSLCVKFYHPQRGGGLLNKICHSDVCRCVEGLTGPGFNRDASPVPAVYKVTYEQAEAVAHTDTYHMRVEQVLKEGTDSLVQGKVRLFMAHPSCRQTLDLTKGRSYLLMGHYRDLVQSNGSYLYSLSESTWIEYCTQLKKMLQINYKENTIFYGVSVKDLFWSR
uniref:NTR domain-containing protein n=1 Tax=Denticeps clupeoides TaxID=299321 RepID=A0AAY4A9N2_9TELE